MSALFSGGEIEFDSRILFNRYFYKYTDWRNRAFEQLDVCYKNKKDSLLFSLDIKSYYYSVILDFSNLEAIFGESEYFDKIKPLSNLMRRVYGRYVETISPFRKDIPALKRNTSILPIGLFSSMVLANVYLGEFDKKIHAQKNMKYYGRYVDDMLFVVERTISQDKTNCCLAH